MSGGVCRACNGTGVRVAQVEIEHATIVHMRAGEPWVYSSGFPPVPVRFALCECITEQLETLRRAFAASEGGT